jgi:hypothetical protein
VDFDDTATNINGTAIVTWSWAMPTSAHLQDCFYCSVTYINIESKTPCDAKAQSRRLAKCGQYYSPYGYSSESIPSLLVTGLKEDQTYCISIHVYLPYPNPTVLASVFWPPSQGLHASTTYYGTNTTIKILSIIMAMVVFSTSICCSA